MPIFWKRDQSRHYVTEDEIWRMRWFLVRLNAATLILSILAGVFIAFITKNALPGLVPAPLLVPMGLMVRWAFSHHPPENQEKATGDKTICSAV